MGKSFYSLLPYLCSGYPRLASQELAFYHAYSGGWRNRCGIPWPLPACHATYLLAEFYSVFSWTLRHNQHALALSWSSEKKSRNLDLTAFVKAWNEVARDAWSWCLKDSALHHWCECLTNNKILEVKELWDTLLNYNYLLTFCCFGRAQALPLTDYKLVFWGFCRPCSPLCLPGKKMTSTKWDYWTTGWEIECMYAFVPTAWQLQVI